MKIFLLILSISISSYAIPNPASVNCHKLGGKLTIIKKDKNGGEFAVCKQGETQCEEWQLFRGECKF